MATVVTNCEEVVSLCKRAKVPDEHSTLASKQCSSDDEITDDAVKRWHLEVHNDDVVLRHTLPVFTGLGRCPIVNWDFAGAVSIFGPDALPVVHQ